MQNFQQTRFLRRPEVSTMTGLSRSSIYAKMDTGAFPKPIKLSERSVAWLSSEVASWIENRVTATRGGVQ